MERPYFKACNHGCRAARAEGQNTNGGCDFPPRLNVLRDECKKLRGHDDDEIRKFARRVLGLIDHIGMKEE